MFEIRFNALLGLLHIIVTRELHVDFRKTNELSLIEKIYNIY